MKRLIILLLLLPSLALAQGGMGPGPGVKAYSGAGSSTWQTGWDPTNSTEYNWGLVQKTWRQVVPASTSSVSGTKVKITFKCSTLGTRRFYMNNAGICEQDSGANCKGAVTQVTFAGGFPQTCTSTAITSQEITFTFDKTKAYIITFENGDDDAEAYVLYNGAAAGFTCYTKDSVHESQTASVSGYTTANNTVVNVDLLEVLSP